MLENKVNYTLVGFFIVCLGSALILAAVWLESGLHRKHYVPYLVMMDEPVAGLNVQAPVKYNGVTVGYVSKIALNAKNPMQVRLELQVEKETPITESTYAVLMAQGITGLSYLGLSVSKPDARPLKKSANEPYPVIPSEPSLFATVDKVVRQVSDDLHRMAQQMDNLLSIKNVRNFSDTLEQMSEFTSVLAKHKTTLDETLQNTNVITANLKEVSVALPKMIDEFSQTSLLIRHTIASGKHSISILNTETLPKTNQLLGTLDNTTQQLEALLSLLNQDPSVLLRGRVRVRGGPGE